MNYVTMRVEQLVAKYGILTRGEVRRQLADVPADIVNRTMDKLVRVGVFGVYGPRGGGQAVFAPERESVAS